MSEERIGTEEKEVREEVLTPEETEQIAAGTTHNEEMSKHTV